jgi:Ca2+/H+ antiporter, TMEM165/GDT1 family
MGLSGPAGSRRETSTRQLNCLVEGLARLAERGRAAGRRPETGVRQYVERDIGGYSPSLLQKVHEAGRSVRRGRRSDGVLKGAFVDLSVIAAAFILVLPVELPDKTLFATLVLATRFKPLPVFTGVGLAFAVQSLIAVTAGSLLTLLPDAVVSAIVAVLFLVGAVILWRSVRSGAEEEEDIAEAPPHPSFLKAASICFGVLFAAEWCDLSQLATAGLAARYDDPLSVFIGSWAALLVVSALAVFLGKKLADKLPIQLIRVIAAVLFSVFAVIAVIETVRLLLG